ncbi:hypothetical protein RZS08_07375, partial [Arthrospira platensis SPKY1]|nr:hypothetical protein [Arthrospira platensis SPKY1]
APLRWGRREDVSKTPPPSSSAEVTVTPAAVSTPLKSPRPKTNRLASLGRWSGTVVGGAAMSLVTMVAGWWRARRAGVDAEVPLSAPEAAIEIPPAAKPPLAAAEPPATADPDFSTSRKPRRIEPVLDWMSPVDPVEVRPTSAAAAEWPVSDLTLVPTPMAAPVRAAEPVELMMRNGAARDAEGVAEDEEDGMDISELEMSPSIPPKPASFAPAEPVAVMVRRVAPPAPAAPYPLPALELLDRPPPRT